MAILLMGENVVLDKTVTCLQLFDNTTCRRNDILVASSRAGGTITHPIGRAMRLFTGLHLQEGSSVNRYALRSHEAHPHYKFMHEKHAQYKI